MITSAISMLEDNMQGLDGEVNLLRSSCGQRGAVARRELLTACEEVVGQCGTYWCSVVAEGVNR